jgi:hypothetical protein
MSIKRLNLVKMKPQRTIVRLPKTIALVVVAVAILWTSLPVFASVEQMGSIGIGTPNCSSLTLQGELEAGAVFQSLIPGPLANWRLSLSGDCVWQVNPVVTVVGRGHVIASLPCLSTNPGCTREFTDANGIDAKSVDALMNAASQDTGHVDLSLDRLFLQYESGRARAIIGKQTVNWGLATVFRPTDLITPRDPGASGEGRPGKILASLFWCTSPLTGIEVVLGEKLYGGRAEFRVGQTNLGILGLTKRSNPVGSNNPVGSLNPACSRNAADSQNPTEIGNQINSGTHAFSDNSIMRRNEIGIANPAESRVETAVGLDFQGGLRGFYGEACHHRTYGEAGQQSSGSIHSGAPAAMATTSGTIGWKTILRGGNLIFAEYYRNHVRLGNVSAITQLAALGLTYQYDEFTTFGIVGVTDLANGIWTATGTLTSLLSENLDLNCGVSITKGPHAEAQVMLKWYL